MKKLFLLLTMFIITLGFTSCKSNKLEGSFDEVDYHISGIYIEMIEDSTYRVGGMNPCIYYSHKTSEMTYSNGNINIQYLNRTKNIVNENNAENIILSTIIVFPSQTEDKVTIYIIKENKDGTFYVDKDMKDDINFNKTNNYNIEYKYSYQNENYRYQLTINYSRKEA